MCIERDVPREPDFFTHGSVNQGKDSKQRGARENGDVTNL